MEFPFIVSLTKNQSALLTLELEHAKLLRESLEHLAIALGTEMVGRYNRIQLLTTPIRPLWDRLIIFEGNSLKRTKRRMFRLAWMKRKV